MADSKEEKQPVSSMVPVILDTATEARIRAIIREELAAYDKRKRQELRFGLPLNSETR